MGCSHPRRNWALLLAGAWLIAVPGSRAAEPAGQPGEAPAAEGVSPEQAARQATMLDVYRRATALANSGDLAAAQQVVEEFGAKYGKDDYFYDELQGTLLAIAKDYTSAQAAFDRMLSRVPDSRIGRFNRAEMILLQARYEEAEQEFRALEEQLSGKDPAIADLCRFKRVLCLLAMDKVGKAGELVPPVREEEESPALSYARATLEFARKNSALAVKLLDEARDRFSVGVDNLYTDSLVELRWGQRDEAGKFFFKPRLR